MSTNQATFRWIAAWIVFLVMLSVLNKTRLGKVVIYYSLVMIFLILVLTQAPFIARILQPIGSPVPQEGMFDSPPVDRPPPPEDI
jgi:hypothetical protein